GHRIQMDTLLHDLRLAVRTLVKHPGFTFAAAVTLALGVGVNTAVFSVVNGVMLRPLPYPEPERVVYLVRELAPPYGQSWALNAFKYDYYRRNTTVFEAMALHEPWAAEIGRSDVPEEARGLRASAGFFAVNAAMLMNAEARDVWEQFKALDRPNASNATRHGIIDD